MIFNHFSSTHTTVNSIFKSIKQLSLQNSRCCHKSVNANSRTKYLVHLNNRTILKISGEDSSDFLQGLITNDVRHLQEGSANMYSVFLNIKGRIMFDTIIYKAKDHKNLYIECDTNIKDSLLKHLKMYKLRKKVDIISYDQDIKVWSAFDFNIKLQTHDEDIENTLKFQERVVPCASVNDTTSVKETDSITIYKDPRLAELGLRILSNFNTPSKEIIQHLESGTELRELEDYNCFRYKLGVGEGTLDYPPGTAFPLEINCDYLHGVSFHKGCYIGQELTARAHHTGVIRKRIMPLILEDADSKFSYDEKIINESEKVVGKFRGQEKKFGLALMRIHEALSSKILKIGHTQVKLVKPFWWPQESQKLEAAVKTK